MPHDLPEPTGDGAMLANLLAYQMARQAKAPDQKAIAQGLAQRLTAQALRQADDRLKWLANFMSVAEFLARETRSKPETKNEGASA